MSTNVPAAFDMSFDGAEGRYTIRFQPVDDWDGRIDVSIGGLPMRWDVVHADREDGGGIVLGGMTTGTEAIWRDQFWFELRMDDEPAIIRYWGDRVIWREDQAA